MNLKMDKTMEYLEMIEKNIADEIFQDYIRLVKQNKYNMLYKRFFVTLNREYKISPEMAAYFSVLLVNDARAHFEKNKGMFKGMFQERYIYTPWGCVDKYKKEIREESKIYNFVCIVEGKLTKLKEKILKIFGRR